MALRNRVVLLAGALCAFPLFASALAADIEVPRPELKPGDTWVFDETVEKGTSKFSSERIDVTVQSLDDETMQVGIKPDGSPMDYQVRSLAPDWSKSRLLDGVSTIIARPFAFPLAPGKRWSIKYIDYTHKGNKISEEHEQIYKVAGWQDVTTPAGTFHTLKIECDVKVKAQLAGSSAAIAGAYSQPGTSFTSSGITNAPAHNTYINTVGIQYYAPSVRNYVKSEESFYNEDSIRIQRTTQTLELFKPGA